MDQNLVYAKTPVGDEAVRQSTRVVQRNLRMVLVQVDGKTTVAELAAKVGNSKLVESALRELEEGGFIAPVLQAPSVWDTGKMAAKDFKAAASQFSTFGSKFSRPVHSQNSSFSKTSGLSKASGLSEVSAFSDFGNPLMPPEIPPEPPAKPESGPGERMAGMFRRKAKAAEYEASPRKFRPVVLLQLGFGLLLLACVALLFYPYNNFKPDIEAALGRALQTEVRIGNIAVEVLPRPALTLQGVKIGLKDEAAVDEIRVLSLLSFIGTGHRKIQDVDITGLAIPADAVGMLAGLGNESTGLAGSFSLGHVRLQRVSIRMSDTALRNLEGEMLFTPGGKLDKVRLQTEDGTLRIEAMPSPKGAMLSIEGMAWKPDEGAPYVFESLQARGLLQPGRLVLSDIDTTFLGGVLKGSWLLTWGDGLAMAGEASLGRMDMRRVMDTFAPSLKIGGELAGALRLRGTGKDWQSMWTNLEVALDADVVRGVIAGVDIGEAARRGVGHNARGGATKFDRLRGALVIDPRRITGRDINLEAGLISANGRFVADRERRVDGVFEVSLAGSVSGVRMPIKVSGTLPDLVVAAGR